MNTAENEEEHKLIDNLWVFSLTVLVVGPLALPLLWRNPRLGRTTKIWLSVIVIAFTVFLMWVMFTISQKGLEQYEMFLDPER